MRFSWIEIDELLGRFLDRGVAKETNQIFLEEWFETGAQETLYFPLTLDSANLLKLYRHLSEITLRWPLEQLG